MLSFSMLNVKKSYFASGIKRVLYSKILQFYSSLEKFVKFEPEEKKFWM